MNSKRQYNNDTLSDLASLKGNRVMKTPLKTGIPSDVTGIPDFNEYNIYLGCQSTILDRACEARR